MKTGPKGRALIKQFEGWRSRAYRDPIGVWTIGYGHTSMAGPPEVTQDMRITKAEGEAILKRDLVKYETAVSRAVKVELAQEQFDALVSFCYNVGPGNFRRSSVLRAVNARQWAVAARRFALWNRAGGRVLPGLVRRRAAEAALFAEAQPEYKLAEAELAEIDVPHGKPVLKSKTSMAGIAQAAGGVALVTGTAAETRQHLEVLSDGLDISQIAIVAATVLGIVCILFGAWFFYDRRIKARDDAI